MADRQPFPKPSKTTLPASDVEELLDEIKRADRKLQIGLRFRDLTRDELFHQDDVDQQRELLQRADVDELFHALRRQVSQELANLIQGQEEEQDHTLAEPAGLGKQPALTEQSKLVQAHERKALSST